MVSDAVNEEWEWEGMERGREGNTRGVGDEGKDSRWFVASWRAQGGESGTGQTTGAGRLFSATRV